MYTYIEDAYGGASPHPERQSYGALNIPYQSFAHLASMHEYTQVCMLPCSCPSMYIVLQSHLIERNICGQAFSETNSQTSLENVRGPFFGIISLTF